MRNRPTILLLLLFNTLTSCYGQTKTIYHEYEPTASDFAIVKWNIPKNKLPRHYLKETIDSRDRVIELKFFENNSTVFDRLCYLNPWIRFEYPNDTTIIQHYMNGKGQPESSLECKIPSKVIYYLNKEKKCILNTETEYQIDTALYLANGWTLNAINDALKEIKENEKTYLTIDYFSKSKAKLKGRFPISKDFDIKNIYFNSTEKSEIKRALNME